MLVLKNENDIWDALRTEENTFGRFGDCLEHFCALLAYFIHFRRDVLRLNLPRPRGGTVPRLSTGSSKEAKLLQMRKKQSEGVYL